MSIADRLANLFGGKSGQEPSAAQVDGLPFEVGDRVTDTWGNAAVVTEIDRKVEHGLGRIRIRYDDGRELAYSVVAHGLKPVDR